MTMTARSPKVKNHFLTVKPNYSRVLNFSIFYKLYYEKVYCKCLSMVKNEAVAEDLTQDVFLKIYTSRSEFRGNAQFSTWIYAVANNCCIDYIRKQQKGRTVTLEEWRRTDPRTEENIEEQTPDIKKRLKQILSILPEAERNILTMKYLDGKSIREIALVLKKTDSAVKMQIKRAKAKARSLCTSPVID